MAVAVGLSLSYAMYSIGYFDDFWKVEVFEEISCFNLSNISLESRSFVSRKEDSLKHLYQTELAQIKKFNRSEMLDSVKFEVEYVAEDIPSQNDIRVDENGDSLFFISCADRIITIHKNECLQMRLRNNSTQTIDFLTLNCGRNAFLLDYDQDLWKEFLVATCCFRFPLSQEIKAEDSLSWNPQLNLFSTQSFEKLPHSSKVLKFKLTALPPSINKDNKELLNLLYDLSRRTDTYTKTITTEIYQK